MKVATQGTWRLASFVLPTLFLAAVAGADSHSSESTAPGCGEWRQPTDADFASIIGKDKAEFLDRVLSVLENEVVPKTMKGVRAGNKIIGE